MQQLIILWKGRNVRKEGSDTEDLSLLARQREIFDELFYPDSFPDIGQVVIAGQFEHSVTRVFASRG